MSIARMQTENREINQLQQNIINATQFLFSNPLLQGSVLKSVALAVGNNLISHKLGRPLQGWFFTRIRGATVSAYDNNDLPSVNTSTTLLLVSNAIVTVDIYVF